MDIVVICKNTGDCIWRIGRACPRLTNSIFSLSMRCTFPGNKTYDRNRVSLTGTFAEAMCCEQSLALERLKGRNQSLLSEETSRLILDRTQTYHDPNIALCHESRIEDSEQVTGQGALSDYKVRGFTFPDSRDRSGWSLEKCDKAQGMGAIEVRIFWTGSTLSSTFRRLSTTCLAWSSTKRVERCIGPLHCIHCI